MPSTAKATYNLEVKARCRRHIKNFIGGHLKRPEWAKVLCFPGREALEIFQIYDKLGIKRENIVALEQERGIFNELKRRNLGCELVNTSFEELVAKPTTEPFTIISLDFMGQLATYEKAIKAMVVNGYLNPSATIVYTNFCGARESKDSKETYSKWDTDKGTNEGIVSLIYDLSLLERYSKEEAELAQKISTKILSQRDLAIHSTVKSYLENGTLRLRNLNRFAETELRLDEKFVQNQEHWFPLHLKAYEERLAKDLHPLLRLNDKPPDHPDSGYYHINVDGPCSNKIEQVLQTVVDHHLWKDYPRQCLWTWHECIAKALHPINCIHDTTSFKYVGDSNVPMFSDIFLVKKNYDYAFLLPYLNIHATTISYLLKPFIDLTSQQLRGVLMQIAQTLRHHGTLNKLSQRSSRAHLGSENKIHAKVHPKTSPEETKALAIKLLKQGSITVEDVMFLTGATKGQIIAWKAHITMGTYS